MSRIVPTFATAIALALAPAPAFAAPATEPAAAPPATEPAAAPVDPINEAKAWHLEADAKYNTADYEGAITSWQKAFAALPRTAEANTYRSLILYNIAAAREKLFALRGDVEQLKQAKILLEQFEASIDETYAAAPEQGEAERARVQEKLAAIDAQIAQSEAEPAPEPEPAPTETPTTNAPVTNPPTTDAPATRSKTPPRTYFIAGGVLAGLGVAAGAGMVAALVVGRRANDIEGLDDRDFAGRETQFNRGRRANIAAFATGALSGVLLAAGVAMLVVGAKRRPARTSLSPVVGRGLAGFAVGGRF
jgi:hypothetical protein